MGLKLDAIVPWGRSYDEYVRMFLTPADLRRRVLGCGDGPAAFNAELARRGGSPVSVDPLYSFDVAQIDARVAATFSTVMAQMDKSSGDYVWDAAIPSVEALGRVRMAAMRTFLADFEAGKGQGRYVAGELPSLPFADGCFDLALSSHFLFLYSSHLSAEFHLLAVKEMLRVAGEVRVFPLLTLDGKASPHLGFVSEALARQGYEVAVRQVPYEFQRGGDKMLLVRGKGLD